MKKEILHPIVLDKTQQTIVDMHSLINIINIIVSEIYLLQIDTFFDNELKEALELNQSFAKDMYSEKVRMKRFYLIDDFISQNNRHLNEFAKQLPPDKLPIFEIARDNLRSIFSILKVRITEILNRFDSEEKWVVHDIAHLKTNFSDVFAAIEKNSKGRYKIVYSADEHDENSYLVDLKIQSPDGKILHMPSIMQDVFRDLIANARKYTEPGGKIRAHLINDGVNLTIEVEDTGIGIPDEEIDLVVDFGYRADNVLHIQTRGGGFGLTKAYHITKRNNGRFWIDSKIGQGTLVKIEIPANMDE
ncbi:MAG: ATP-binding protein [Candidatus Kapabacteria bacterium]|nr:ATP-binding protein [Candidatus Kapabacteria bacterium]